MRKKILAGILAAVMLVTMMPGSLMEKAGAKKEVKAAVTLQNPRIETDASMKAGQKVTYDCVWFGSYPQTEIVDKASTCGTYGKVWGQSSDYEENSSLYTILQNATGWDSNGDITLDDGTKYRRLKSSDATYYGSYEGNYEWNSSEIYHFFRYDPIKWRVLDVNGSHALLLADEGLDDKQYNTIKTEITWKTCTVRSWLNGYGASANSCSTDYTGKNFINSAFTSLERNGIESYYLDNKTTGPFAEKNGEQNTTDKIFLLSSNDLYESNQSVTQKGELIQKMQTLPFMPSGKRR